MDTLSQRLLPPSPALIDDLASAVEKQVSKLGGLKGISLRTALGMLRATREDALADAMRRLLPEMLRALEPLHEQYGASADAGGDFGAYAQAHRSAVSAALQSVLDERVERSSHGGLRSTYPKLRVPIAAVLDAAAPEIAGTIGRHYATAPPHKESMKKA